MKQSRRDLFLAAWTMCVFAAVPRLDAQAQSTSAPRPAPRLVLWVTSNAWADGAEIPMTYAAHGENKSPAFEFHWNLGAEPASAPPNLQTYAVIFHDVQNSTNKTTTDALQRDYRKD